MSTVYSPEFWSEVDLMAARGRRQQAKRRILVAGKIDGKKILIIGERKPRPPWRSIAYLFVFLVVLVLAILFAGGQIGVPG